MHIRSLSTIILSIFFIFACRSEKEDTGTAQMSALLSDIHENMPPENPFYNRLRVDTFKSMPEPSGLFEKFQYLASIGQEQLYAGDTEDALNTLYKVRELIEANLSQFPPELPWMVTDVIALAYLRLGEQENCIENPTSASCILPIRGEGVHQLTRGSLNAINQYKTLLDSDFGTLNHRWLMNIAYMTLEEYPDSVPPEFLVPESLFHSDIEFPYFNEIGQQLGVDVLGLSGASIVDDFTGNGYLDIFTTSWNLGDQARLFVNNGDGTFSDHTHHAGLTGITGGLNAVHGDYTNNGYPDIYLLRGAWMGELGEIPNSLLRNNGDGTFTDVTFKAGVDGAYPTQTASWGDFNNDGLLDLIVGYESADNKNYPAQLFRNNGDGTFTDVAEVSGINFTGFVKGVVWGDFNNNGLLDLYVSRLGSSNSLFENRGADDSGHWRFEDVASIAGVQEPIYSFPIWFWDFNNDGLQDIFVASYNIEYDDVLREFLDEQIVGDYPRLYRNNGDGTFTNVADQVNLNKVLYAMGSNFGDLDNDGYLDFYTGTGDPDYRSLMPNRMFKNDRGQQFQEVTYAGGFGTIQKGHGVSFADLNNNGFQDLYTNMGGALEGDVYQNLFFENPGNNHNWITLTLQGEMSNRSALHSKIRIDIEENGIQRSIHRVVSSGGSFGGSPFRQEIGLGEAEIIKKIEIYWPSSNITQIFENVTVNAFYRVHELEDQLIESDIRTFKYETASDPARAVHHSH